jgi:hypothetical protein
MVVGWAMNALQDATLIELGYGGSKKQSFCSWVIDSIGKINYL